MTEEKRRRTKVAIIVGAILLLVILLAVMLYQIIAIQVKKRDLNELNAKIEYYRELKETGEDVLEIRSTREWIERRARELGYVFINDTLYPENEAPVSVE